MTAQAGEQLYTHARIVASDKLNEDPGSDLVWGDDNTPSEPPHGDELYAQVVASDQARSTTVPFLLV